MERRNVKNIRVIRRLLERPDGQWTRYSLAKASGCSRQWVILMLRKLEAAHLVKETRVEDRLGLARFGAALLPDPVRVAEFYVQDPVEFLERHAKSYAITTYFGEDRVTHYLFPTRCDAYVTQEEFPGVARAIIGLGLLGRGNLRLMVPVDPSVIRDARGVRGACVVPLGQLMMDLIKEGGVCDVAVEEMVNRDVRAY